MLSLALAPLLLSQQAVPAAPEERVPVATPPVPAETLKARIFVVEYPVAISPSVAEYTNCLRSRDVVMGSGQTFESEHRRAVPLCTKVEIKTKQAAFDRLAETPKYAMTMAQLGELYEGIRMTHINRGRVMDGFMDRGLDRDPYEEQVGKAEEKAVDLAASAPVPAAR